MVTANQSEKKHEESVQYQYHGGGVRGNPLKMGHLLFERNFDKKVAIKVRRLRNEMFFMQKIFNMSIYLAL